MEDLGPPIGWPALPEGTPVYDPSGARVGVAERVLGERDIFEGLIIHTHPLPGRHVFADVDQIAALHERGVRLSVERDALRAPPPDSADSRRRDRDRERSSEEPRVEAGLRRFWDWITRR